MATPYPTVEQLRDRWKPHRAALNAQRKDHPTPIRLFRAFSWMARAEPLDPAVDADFILLAQWIALNALYGQWDPAERASRPDVMSYQAFFKHLLTLDADGQIAAFLVEQRPLVLSILDDEFASRFFWEQPDAIQATKARRARREAPTWYYGQRWLQVLDRVLERVYLVRCQLVHGAASYKSGLNRKTLARCTQFMAGLLPTVIGILIDHGANEDWGVMCYPPLTPTNGRA